MAKYLYIATTLTLAIFYGTVVVTVSALLRLMSGVESDFQTRQALATGLGITVVAGPLWWLHWRGLRWQVNHEPTPASRRHYRTYLIAVVAVTIFAAFGSAGASVMVFMRLALGLLPQASAGWVQGLPWLVALLTATGLWWLHWQPLLDTGVIEHKRPQPTGRRVTPVHSASA